MTRIGSCLVFCPKTPVFLNRAEDAEMRKTRPLKRVALET